jgi:hypothetical protein
MIGPGDSLMTTEARGRDLFIVDNYQKIVFALSETIRLMEEMDPVVNDTAAGRMPFPGTAPRRRRRCRA